ncbi:hypothetical protein D1007_25839 [Hordeum vulgare]|nr:hypothetical protein D1007_25839 [Hordeum vulgare]
MMVPIFFHSLFAALVPPFFDFLLAIPEHYGIRLLLLHPNSILVLALFAYLCESFLGLMSFVALFRTFYSLQVFSSRNYHPGGASFHIDDEMCMIFVDTKISEKVEKFRNPEPNNEEKKQAKKKKTEVEGPSPPVKAISPAVLTHLVAKLRGRLSHHVFSFRD